MGHDSWIVTHDPLTHPKKVTHLTHLHLWSEGTHRKFANIGIWNYYYIELQCDNVYYG